MSTDKIVYSCSGCSFGGQAANRTALYLDKVEIAEMSCLAGIASGGKSFFNKIKGKRVWMIDGCRMNCGKQILEKAGVSFVHYNMDEFGIKKYKKSLVRLKAISEKMLKKDEELG